MQKIREVTNNNDVDMRTWRKLFVYGKKAVEKTSIRTDEDVVKLIKDYRKSLKK